MSVSPRVLDLVVHLADRERRRAAAAELAAELGAADLIIFTADPELDVLLPAPGFPQTLPPGRVWRAFLAACVRERVHRAELPALAGGDPTGALGLAGEDGSVLVLLGGHPSLAAVEEVGRLLPLVAAALRGERATQTAAGQEQAARNAAERAQSLASALDATRRDLADALAEARHTARQRDAFLSIAAHELKTPITSLRGMTQLLLRRLARGQELDAGRLGDGLTLIDRQSVKLTRLVGQLLDISRLEAGSLTIEPEPADLSALAASVVQTMQVVAPQHHFVLRAPDSVPARVDVLRLEQVLINLIDNAVKFSPPDSPIEIDVAQNGVEAASLSVRDWGPGIDPRHHPYIFNRFYQVHNRQYNPGLGIGLFVSREIVQLHGGRLEIECPPDGGTRFVATLPTGPSRPE